VAARWQVCRELVGCVCKKTRANGAVVHREECPQTRRKPQDARKPVEWTQEARDAAAARLRARWEAIGPLERSELARYAVKGKRRRWSWERRRAHSLRMRQIWREWRSGIRPTSAKQVRFLCEMGMWPNGHNGGRNG
jgi:hypothetical protein